MKKRRILLIHRDAGKGCRRAAPLTASGYKVECGHLTGPSSLREIRERPPDAVVISLESAPSHGRDVGLALRSHRATRQVPLVFGGGEPGMVRQLRGILPDAVYTPWNLIRSSLRRAIAHPPADPVRPASLLQGYSGTPLVRKLGIRADMTVGVVGAPNRLAETLGRLPRGTALRRLGAGGADLILWFNRSLRDLNTGLPRIVTVLGRDGVWIAWPKRASGVKTDLSQAEVRRFGLKAGLVDYKICSIDATWSALKFTRRKPGRS